MTRTIDILTDDALLEIFYHFREEGTYAFKIIWIPLLHVCKRWRRIILASPQRLHLLLPCDDKIPAKKSLDIWPTLPFKLNYGTRSWRTDVHPEDIIAALKHHDRIAEIDLDMVPPSVFEKISTFMQEPLPVLKRLHISWSDYFSDSDGPDLPLVFPETFLGGSTPRLQDCSLHGFIFPALPTLLISAHHLVSLVLSQIPVSGFASPEVMAHFLSTLPNLNRLELIFIFPKDNIMTHSDLTSPSRAPLTAANLPSLLSFTFEGHSEYLEDLLARIDATSIFYLNVHLFLKPVAFISHLYRLISHNKWLKGFHKCYVHLNPWNIFLGGGTPGRLFLTSYSGTLGSQTSFMTQLSENRVDRVEGFDIYGGTKYGVISEEVNPQGDMGTQQWLDLFRPFTAAKRLFVGEDVVPAVVDVLRGLPEGMAAEVLPALRTLILREPDWIGSLREAIEPFPTAHELSGRPVSLMQWGPRWR